ncbi:MotA/TolQ/ExbB proton channel family protein [Pukyongiella litopenaei]|uniref:MotA/TolQ/ExbB proton channel family protein n=1 Tax=Pukyongiella litopenaei TaxID=2605946 RepID=A0A2S0MU58_9RHOB|nr:MotA/TolQ/ExbB proton channel family protein [Pukyongiella litopenaei]AVO39408.1 MotA/TolQ/ExbB proton channel family protein [Pukyongiella litopenaei]
MTTPTTFRHVLIGWSAAALLAVIPAPAPAQQSAVPSLDAQAPAAPALPDTETAGGAGLSDTPAPDAAPDATPAGAGADPVDAGAGEAPPPEISLTEPYFDMVRDRLPERFHDEADWAQSAADKSGRFLRDGGPTIWAIAALSVITVAIILWKIWRLALVGAWSKGRARKAVDIYAAGQPAAAADIVEGRRGVRSRVVRAAIAARADKPAELAREETARVARHELAEAATGLRALELIATIAPLLGLLGTVLGMIAAFQALQESGSRADPSMLAGGIWEALLTTAAGMAVAIPASAGLTWFESVIDRMRRDIEDAVTRIFVSDTRTTPDDDGADYGADPAAPLAAE